MFNELQDAPWIQDCERWGYPQKSYWYHERHYNIDDGFVDSDDMEDEEDDDEYEC